MASSEAQRFCENCESQCENGRWQSPRGNRHRRIQKNNDKDDRKNANQTRSRTFTNSKPITHNQRRQPSTDNALNQNTERENESAGRISKHATEYASEYHVARVRLECQPKLTDKEEGHKLITEMINAVKKDFMAANPRFNKVLLSHLWCLRWIDP